MTILLVDDEILALHALEKRVDWDEYGFSTVLSAQSAAEARALLEQNEVELALCDIEMPEEDGLSLVAHIRSAYPKTECIMVTCYADFTYAQRAMRSGVMDYILKPIDYEELNKLLLRFVQTRKGQAAPEEQARNTDRRLDQVIAYIEGHIGEKIYISDLARQVHLNEQYMMRVFKRSFGKTVMEYITQRRIEKAKTLLKESDYPIQYISDQVGFENFSYFTKLFKNATGLTPREYRNQPPTRSVGLGYASDDENPKGDRN